MDSINQENLDSVFRLKAWVEDFIQQNFSRPGKMLIAKSNHEMEKINLRNFFLNKNKRENKGKKKRGHLCFPTPWIYLL